MTSSPIGVVPFEALGREWSLKYGHRQRFAAEQAFGCGFIGVFLKVFPTVPEEAILSGDSQAVDRQVSIGNLAIGALALLFACGVLEKPDDDTVDALVEELGYQRVVELVSEAIAASMPSAKADAPGEAGAGTARKGRAR